MKRNQNLFWFAHLFLIFLVLLSTTSVKAQLPASPPIADPADTRFQQVTEDWSSPALTKSHLKPATPLIGYINKYPGYSVELTQLQWRFGDPLDLYVIKPANIKKPPVILYLYGYPADTDRFQNEDFQKAVTKDGFAAVGFVSALTGHRYHDRPMREWFISELQECLSASAHDVQMILDYLETRGDLDTGRMGMYAQGSGASIAILASAVDRRIRVLDTIDPWGDWPTWMANSPFVPEEERPAYVKPEFLQKVSGLEPVDWIPKVLASKFRMQDAIFETTTPKIAKEKLRAAAADHGTITIYKTADDFNALVRQGKQLEWIENQLRSLATESPGDLASKQ